jgi:type VI protein secretion system component VasF
MKLEFQYTADDIRHSWRAMWRAHDRRKIGGPVWIVGIVALVLGFVLWWYSLIFRHQRDLDS